MSPLFPAAGPVPLPGVHRSPTPLEYNPAASQDLRIELWVKREDLCDSVGSGHKARKLSYVLADAVDRGTTVVVSAASLPSGQACGLAAHGRQHGLRTHVVYCGDAQRRPDRPRGYYLLVALLGATVTWRELSAWDDWPSYVADVAEQERARGEIPYVAVPGLSTWPGMLGSIDLGLELAEQLPGDGTPVHLVAAAGSGGTCLGMAIAGHALSLPWTVHGVCIGGPLAGTARELGTLCAEAASALRVAASPGDVRLHDGARGAGYDQPRPAELEAISEALARYQLLLDPTYTGKAFIGLRQLVDRGDIPAGSRVVFVHTGGGFGLFNQSTCLDEWADQALASSLGPASSRVG